MARRRGAWAVALVAGLALFARNPPIARAQAPAPIRERIQMHLKYQGENDCDVPETFKNAVRVILHTWEVFSETSAWRLQVDVTGSDDSYTGKAVLNDPQGIEVWKREKIGPAKCAVVLGDIAAKLSLAILPRSPKPVPVAALVPAPGAPPSPQELPPADPLPPAPPPKPPLFLRLGAAFVGDYATVPKLVPGVAVTLGARYTWFSAEAEGRWDPSASLPLANTGSLSVARLTGGVALCGHIAIFAPCLLGQASEIQTVGTWLGAPPTTIARGAVGLRAAANLALWRRLIFLAPTVDVLAPFALSVSPPSGASNSLRVNAAVGVGLLVEYAP